MPSDHRNPVQDGASRGYYNNPQQQRESETGISVDRHYDIGYNTGMQDGKL